MPIPKLAMAGADRCRLAADDPALRLQNRHVDEQPARLARSLVLEIAVHASDPIGKLRGLDRLPAPIGWPALKILEYRPIIQTHFAQHEPVGFKLPQHRNASLVARPMAVLATPWSFE